MPHLLVRGCISCLLGGGTAGASAWLCAATAELDQPREIAFQAARLSENRVVNVLRVTYVGGRAEVIAARVHDDHSFPRTVTQAESDLINALYMDWNHGDAPITVLPVVERVADLQIPAWSGVDRWTTFALAKGEPVLQSHERFRVEQGFGWPWPLARASFAELHGFAGWTIADGVSGKVLTDRTGVTPELLPRARVLPSIPATGPFLLAAAVFGAAWFVLIAGVAGVRIRIRRMRGRCPVCGYDLRGRAEAGCSECGWNRDPGPCL